MLIEDEDMFDFGGDKGAKLNKRMQDKQPGVIGGDKDDNDKDQEEGGQGEPMLRRKGVPGGDVVNLQDNLRIAEQPSEEEEDEEIGGDDLLKKGAPKPLGHTQGKDPRGVLNGDPVDDEEKRELLMIQNIQPAAEEEYDEEVKADPLQRPGKKAPISTTGVEREMDHLLAKAKQEEEEEAGKSEDPFVIRKQKQPGEKEEPSGVVVPDVLGAECAKKGEIKNLDWQLKVEFQGRVSFFCCFNGIGSKF